MKRIVVICLAVVLILIPFTGVNCSSGGSATIEDAITGFWSAYNDGDYAKCLTYCSGYEDDEDIDKEIPRLAGLKDDISDVILHSIENINISGSIATVSVSHVVVGQIYTQEINMVKQGGRWKINSGPRDMFVTEIYTINADGSNCTRITNNEIWELQPCWSPDETKIAFVVGGYIDNVFEDNVYVVNVDGSNMVLLDNGVWPCWSPDSRKIVYRNNNYICIINADGNEKIKLTCDSESTSELKWVLDSSKISYGCNHDIYIVNADGTGRVNLTDSVDREEFVAWSLDGSKLAYSIRRGSFDSDIYVMNADGTGKLCVAGDTGSDPDFSWSPDSTRLAFFSNREGTGIYGDVYVVNADGSELARLTNLVGWINDIRWSPDGDKIVFSCIINPVPEQEPTEPRRIYVVNADGSDLACLTDEGDEGYSYPRWSPDGSKIACIGGHWSNLAIYVMDSDGSCITRLLGTAYHTPAMQWSPDGEKILFIAAR